MMNLQRLLEIQASESSPWETIVIDGQKVEAEFTIEDSGIAIQESNGFYYLENTKTRQSLGVMRNLDMSLVTPDTKFTVRYCVASRDVINPETGEITAKQGTKAWRCYVPVEVTTSVVNQFQSAAAQ